MLSIWSKLLSIEDYVERIIIGFAVQKSGSVTAVMADAEHLIALWGRCIHTRSIEVIYSIYSFVLILKGLSREDGRRKNEGDKDRDKSAHRDYFTIESILRRV